ncbi:hypothetical protein [Siccibacter turicensis]|uniref:hypothetical protein n=1 Tax=Siccibacter turicensis TaxID=357233 RepID=UPI003F574F3D
MKKNHASGRGFFISAAERNPARAGHLRLSSSTEQVSSGVVFYCAGPSRGGKQKAYTARQMALSASAAEQTLTRFFAPGNMPRQAWPFGRASKTRLQRRILVKAWDDALRADITSRAGTVFRQEILFIAAGITCCAAVEKHFP